MMKKSSVFACTAFAALLCAGSALAAGSGGVYERFLGSIRVNGRQFQTNAVTIDDSTYLPLRDLGELLNRDVDWDASSRTISITDSTTPVDSYEAYDGAKFPLLAALPEEDIYLYGLKPEGMILYQADKATYVAGQALSPRFILPRLAAGDYDQDGQKEVVWSVTANTGTGLNQEELYLLDGDTVYHYDAETYSAQLKASLKPTLSTRNQTLTLTVSNTPHVMDISGYMEDGRNFTAITFKNLVSFYPSAAGISVAFTVEGLDSTKASSAYFGTITANVDFDQGAGFTLKDISFAPEDAISMERVKYLLDTDLYLESFFNGASDLDMKGDDAHAPYYPVKNDRFQSVADIETVVRNLYANETKVEQYLSQCRQDAPEEDYVNLYLDIDGKLYGNSVVGGKGLPLFVETDLATLRDVTTETATILLPYTFTIGGVETGVLEIPAAMQDGVWKLQQGVYDTWNAME